MGYILCQLVKGSHLNSKDMLFVFSVGGGNLEKNISVNILKSLQLGQEVGSKICGVVGRDGGYTAQVADECIAVPTVNEAQCYSSYRGFSGSCLAFTCCTSTIISK